MPEPWLEVRVPHREVRLARVELQVALGVPRPIFRFEEGSQRQLPPGELREHPATSSEAYVCEEVEGLVDRVELFDRPTAGGRIGPSDAEPPSPAPRQRPTKPRLDASRRVRTWRNSAYAVHGRSLSPLS